MIDAGTSPAGQDLRGKVALLREDPGVAPADQVRAAADAGAVLALVTPAQHGILRGTGAGLPIPGATLSYEDGERLRERLPGRLDLTGVVDSPYTYDLTFHDPDRVPDSMTRRVRTGDLARIDARYRDDGSSRFALLSRFPTEPCSCSLVRVFELHRLPYRRIEYVSTGEAVWSVHVQGGLAATMRARDLSYQARRYTETWGGAPLAPTATSAVNETSTRDGDTLHLRVSPIADAQGHSGGSRGPSTGVLYRNGDVVAELFAGFGDIPVPAGEAAYRLEVSTSNGSPDSGRLSTTTRTAWTFRSGHVDGEPATLPLLSPSYALPLNLVNAADPHRAVRLRLTAAYPDHAPATLSSAEVSVSYDDGARWEPARVIMLPHGRVQAMLPLSGGQDGYASLRVQLRDEAGNTVEQTILRAYRLVG